MEKEPSSPLEFEREQARQYRERADAAEDVIEQIAEFLDVEDGYDHETVIEAVRRTKSEMEAAERLAGEISLDEPDPQDDWYWYSFFRQVCRALGTDGPPPAVIDAIRSFKKHDIVPIIDIGLSSMWSLLEGATIHTSTAAGKIAMRSTEECRGYTLIKEDEHKSLCIAKHKLSDINEIIKR